MATKSRKSNPPVIAKQETRLRRVIASNQRGNPLIDSTQPVALNDDRIVGKLLIFTGTLIILTVIILTQIDSLAPAKAKVYLPVNTQSQNLTPKSVQILNKTKITPIKNGIYQNGKWELSDESALYLTSSGIPGKPGNIVIYGHNTENIFADLKKTKIGDQIQIETESGKKLTFKTDVVKSVLSNAVEILSQGPEQRITLYTCTGLLDSMRFVVSGILLNNA